MFGKIKFISESAAHVENTLSADETTDLMNLHVIFEAPNQRILGEVAEINPDNIKITFLGEYIDDRYVNGVIRKPLISSKIRVINQTELQKLIGLKDTTKELKKIPKTLVPLYKSKTLLIFLVSKKVSRIFLISLSPFLFT